ncbi:MAG: DUF1598 domain-containing protein [Planctomycetaceae bacterium]|jgi:hypothetical protein|nr:DUF1598 domain-containing protein [Planctomycetaceae bacterium]
MLFVTIILCALFFGGFAAAGNPPDFRSTGCGIEIGTDGTVVPLSKEKAISIGKLAAKPDVPADLNKSVPLRKISLKKFDAEMKEIVEKQKFIPDAMRYLGGLTSIKYIAVIPEEKDILLIGPAEGWKNDSAGNIIGAQSGSPMMMLEDFLTVLMMQNRFTHQQGIITCSIEPASDALGKIVKVQQRYSTIDAKNAGAYADELENAFGKMPIAITGVPLQSRFAKVLAAADLKMKRIALGLEPAAVRNVPSYISLISGSRPVNPRFWIVPEYSPVTHDSKKLTYQLSNLKIRVFAEEDYFAVRQNIKRENTDRAAVQWCKRVEENFDALVKSQPVFGELVKDMEIAFVAAVIQQEKLLQKADCRLLILHDESKLKLIPYPQPKSVESKSVISKIGYSSVVACGGIEINPFGVLQTGLDLNEKMDAERKKLIQTKGKEWWSP